MVSFTKLHVLLHLFHATSALFQQLAKHLQLLSVAFQLPDLLEVSGWKTWKKHGKQNKTSVIWWILLSFGVFRNQFFHPMIPLCRLSMFTAEIQLKISFQNDFWLWFPLWLHPETKRSPSSSTSSSLSDCCAKKAAKLFRAKEAIWDSTRPAAKKAQILFGWSRLVMGF